MPNHVTTLVYADPQVIDSFMRDSVVDFETVIPMPEDIVRGNMTFEEIQKSNGRNWYDWSHDNWGTKWNAYNSERISDHCVRFDTAWATPVPVLEKLSERGLLHVVWADEDTGYNAGEAILKDGHCIVEHIPEGGSTEAYLIYVRVKHENILPDYYQWKDGKLDYVDE